MMPQPHSANATEHGAQQNEQEEYMREYIEQIQSDSLAAAAEESATQLPETAESKQPLVASGLRCVRDKKPSKTVKAITGSKWAAVQRENFYLRNYPPAGVFYVIFNPAWRKHIGLDKENLHNYPYFVWEDFPDVKFDAIKHQIVDASNYAASGLAVKTGDFALYVWLPSEKAGDTWEWKWMKLKKDCFVYFTFLLFQKRMAEDWQMMVYNTFGDNPRLPVESFVVTPWPNVHEQSEPPAMIVPELRPCLPEQAAISIFAVATCKYRHC